MLIGTSWSQVPGLVRTASGYDTLRGKDALCWFSQAFHEDETDDSANSSNGQDTQQNWMQSNDAGAIGDDFDGQLWEDSVMPGFKSGPTTLMRSCPEGTSLQVDVLQEEVAGSFIFRTGHYYVFRIAAEIDLQVIRRYFDLSQDSTFSGDLGVRIEFCPVSAIIGDSENVNVESACR